jgi:hypothetical protein
VEKLDDPILFLGRAAKEELMLLEQCQTELAHEHDRAIGRQVLLSVDHPSFPMV